MLFMRSVRVIIHFQLFNSYSAIDQILQAKMRLIGPTPQELMIEEISAADA